ncbi:MAG: PhzF family phenazine biosynthesis protein [Bdellovibrionales bacterium]
MIKVDYKHVDVFSAQPLSGNGLIVFETQAPLAAELMQRLTQEMRQFESIFLVPADRPGCFRARVFTMEEELPFAGHPLLGAASILHDRYQPSDLTATWILELSGSRSVRLATRKMNGGFRAEMDQGIASFGPALPRPKTTEILQALGLNEHDLARDLALQQVSTGLPYLIVPVAGGLERARIRHSQFEGLLAQVGAKFVYVLDVDQCEGRTWDNLGLVEDVATGSAAGPAAAYLTRHGLLRPAEWVSLHQGRFVGRPSVILTRVEVMGSDPSADELRVHVAGDVCLIASGTVEF